jgi:hypothetical protein
MLSNYLVIFGEICQNGRGGWYPGRSKRSIRQSDVQSLRQDLDQKLLFTGMGISIEMNGAYLVAFDDGFLKLCVPVSGDLLDFAIEKVGQGSQGFFYGQVFDDAQIQQAIVRFSLRGDDRSSTELATLSSSGRPE